MPKLGGCQDHLVDGAAAVGPVGVCVAVAPQRREEALPAVGQGCGCLVLQRPQVCRELASQCLLDDRRGGLADAGQVLERARLGPARQLGGVGRPDDADGSPERLDPVGAGALALEEERDAPQRVGGLDGSGEGVIAVATGDLRP